MSSIDTYHVIDNYHNDTFSSFSEDSGAVNGEGAGTHTGTQF